MKLKNKTAKPSAEDRALADQYGTRYEDLRETMKRTGKLRDELSAVIINLGDKKGEAAGTGKLVKGKKWAVGFITATSWVMDEAKLKKLLPLELWKQVAETKVITVVDLKKVEALFKSGTIKSSTLKKAMSKRTSRRVRVVSIADLEKGDNEAEDRFF